MQPRPRRPNTTRFAVCLCVVAAAHILIVVGILATSRMPTDTPVPPPPPALTTPSPPATEEAPTPVRPERIHHVAAGESYWSIARRYNVSIDALLTHNGRDNNSLLRPGDELRIPAAP